MRRLLSDTYANTHANTYANTHANTYANTHANTDTDTDTDSNTYAYAYAYTDADADAYTDSGAYANPNNIWFIWHWFKHLYSNTKSDRQDIRSEFDCKPSDFK